MIQSAADEDYIMARSSVRFGLHYSFFWHAAQAIEKYLKCIHALNLGAINHFRGHRFLDIFDPVDAYCGDLIPCVLCPPRYFPKNGLSRPFEPTRDFLSRIQEMGSPDARYREISIAFQGYDLHKLDELSFCLRRLCFVLTAEDAFHVSVKEYLRSDRRHQPNSFRFLPKNHGRTNELTDILAWRNFSFFEKEAIEKGEYCRGYMGVYTSEISFIEQWHLDDPDARAALIWLADNVLRRKSDKQYVREIASGPAGADPACAASQPS